MTAACPDTSVVVAGLCAWHPDHERARSALAQQPVALVHVLFESYSVLTRLPAHQRVDPLVAWRALGRAFPNAPVQLSPEFVKPLLERLANNGIAGGATYDALVASSALHAGLALQTLDKRARDTYAAVGAEVVWLGDDDAGREPSG